MATYSATSGSAERAAWTTTYDSPYLGTDMTEVVAGMQAERPSGTGTWSGPTARSGLNGADRGSATGTYDSPYFGNDPTQVVAGMQALRPTATATWDGPRGRPGFGKPRPAGVTTDYTTPYEGNDPTQVVAGMQDERPVGTGISIPTSYFRTMTGRVLDEAGEPITNALYLVALDNFASAALVDAEGAFRMYLLRQEYEHFFLVVDAAANEVRNATFDFVWYELDENPTITPTSDDVELKFDTRVKRPLDLTQDTRFRGL